jgi:alpha-L-arabinofuranosidase
VVVTVSSNETLKPMSRRYLGYNHEWYGLQSLFLNKEGNVDSAALMSTKDIPVPFNRVSGTVSQELVWKEAIGSAEERTTQKIAPWAPPLKILFGPIEWVKWLISQDPEAEVTWTINMLKDSPQDAADLVQFLTGTNSMNLHGGIDWVKRRKDLGLEHPVKVAVWEIGNEMDLKVPDKNYTWDVDHYIASAEPIIDAIKSVDPNAKIAIQGSSSFQSDWNMRVLKALGSKADYLVVHLYYQGSRTYEKGKGFNGSPQKQVEKWLNEASGQIQEATGSDRIKLYVSEYAQWPWQSTDRPWQEAWWQTHSLDACLTTAQMITWYLNRPSIALAAYHSFYGGPWKLLGAISETAMADTFRLLAHMGGAAEVVPVQLAGFGIGTSPAQSDFSAAAVRSNGKLQVLLVNRGEARTAHLQFQSSLKITGALCLTGLDLDSYNTRDHHPVTLKPWDLSQAVENTLPIPAHSLLLIDLEPTTSISSK